MRRFFIWWSSAPFDERFAIALVLTIWGLGALFWIVDPASSHP